MSLGGRKRQTWDHPLGLARFSRRCDKRRALHTDSGLILVVCVLGDRRIRAGEGAGLVLLICMHVPGRAPTTGYLVLVLLLRRVSSTPLELTNGTALATATPLPYKL